MNLVPQPPVDAVISHTVDRNVTAVMATLAAVALLFSLYYWRRTGRPTFLVLFAAGGAMMLLEPFVDTVGGCWHPANATRGFELWGRPMPLWLCLAYFVYFGIGGGLTWLALRRRNTPRAMWTLFAAGMAGDLVLEVTLLHWDTYVYYGDQPASGHPICYRQVTKGGLPWPRLRASDWCWARAGCSAQPG